MDASNKWRVCLPVSLVLLFALLPSAAWAGRIDCKPNIRCDGTDRQDNIFGTDGPDEINGHEGGDHIKGRGGADLMYGGPVNDSRSITFRSDGLTGGAGPDELHGGRADVLFGGWGDDRLLSDGDTFELRGERGDDRLVAGPGPTLYFFNEVPGRDIIIDTRVKTDDPCGEFAGVPNQWGNDMWFADKAPQVRINLKSSALRDEVEVVGAGGSMNWKNDAIAEIHSGLANDLIKGSDQADCLYAKGSDVIRGERGRDVIVGWSARGYLGADDFSKIFAGPGDDLIDVRSTHPERTLPDKVDCGPGQRDKVQFNPGDIVENCEILRPED